MEEEGQLVWIGPLHLSTVTGMCMCRACPSLAVVKVLLGIQISVYPTLELFPTLVGLGTRQRFRTPGLGEMLSAPIFKFLIILRKSSTLLFGFPLGLVGGIVLSTLFLSACLSLSFSGVPVCNICIRAGKSVCTCLCTQVGVRC